MSEKYDIFISYRRDGGYETAKHLYDLLNHDGYRVSFDLDTLRNGDFDTELLKRIDCCKDFLLVVSSNAFERTLDPSFPKQKDWLRCELSYALSKNKNIVPIFLAGVSGFPDNLPDDINGVVKKNGPLYNRYYFDDFYRRLKNDFLLSKPNIPRNRFIGILVVSILIVIAAVFGVFFFNNPQENDVLDEQSVSPGQNQRIVQNKNEFFYDYNELEIGDFVYEDGAFSHEKNDGKTPIGIVFSLEPTAEERNNGWTHGLMIAAEDCGNGEYYQWCTCDTVLPYPYMVVEFDMTKLGLQDKQGYLYTYKGVTNSSDFPAFVAARRHEPRLKNGSGWYIPTLGQWADMLRNLGGVDVNTLRGVVYDSETAFNYLKKYGLSDDYYWTATQTNYGAWVIYLGNGEYNGSTEKTNRCKVRTVCAF